MGECNHMYGLATVPLVSKETKTVELVFYCRKCADAFVKKVER